MQNDYKIQFNHYLNFANNALADFFNNLNDKASKTIVEAMRYAVMGGGKRIRAILCLACADMLNIPLDAVKEYCVAIECIQAYSLVHDDLPAMDNDDFRRGKLSTHKKFGEANGILAGDALLNFAFEVCLLKENFSAFDAKALYTLAQASGYSGMIAGQVLDLENENNDVANEEILYDIYLNKTAKLITAPLLISSELCGGKYRVELEEFGKNLGILFQIVDDIMDVEGTFESIGKTPNKDKDENKLTSIKVFGLNGAKERSKYHYNKCKAILKKLPQSQFLCDLTDAMFVRKN